MGMHRGFAARLGRFARLFKFFRFGHDLVLFLLVALDLSRVLRLLLAGGQRRSKLREVLLVALGLIEIPLVRRFGLLDRRFVFEEQCLALRGAGHVAERGADGRQDRGHHGDAAGKRIAAVRVLDLVIVRTVNVKMIFGHGTPRVVECEEAVARA